MENMLKAQTKFEISKENVAEFEQVAIIKFLAKEKTPDYEIFCRLQKIYKRKTLDKEKIFSLTSRFSEKSIFEECQDEVKLTVNENGDVLFTADSYINLDSSISSGLEYSSDIDSEQAIFLDNKRPTKRKRSLGLKNVKRKRPKSKKAYLQTEFKQEAPDIELEYVDMEENETEEGVSSIEEVVFDKGFFDDDQLKDVDLLSIKLPFLPIMTPEKITEVLMKLHSDFVCKLCEPKNFQFQSCLRRHILMAHAQRTVRLDDQMSVRCRRSCVKDSRGHFHCSKCLKSFLTYRRLFVHFQRHFFKGGKPASLLETNVIHTRCLCVDRECGVFMVQKTDFGAMVPIHVQKTESISQCSEVLCRKAMAIAIGQNNTEFEECKHLQRVSSNPSCKVEICDLSCTSLSPRSSHQQECLDLLNYAKRKKVSPVIEWPVNEKLVYYSVISTSSSAWFCRSLVKYVRQNSEFQCSTCLSTPCVHCDLVNMYINQVEG